MQETRDDSAEQTLETSLKSRMPFGEEESKVSRCVLFRANSAMNLSIAVVTSGESAHASRQERSVGRCAGYSHSNSKPVQGAQLSAATRCTAALRVGNTKDKRLVDVQCQTDSHPALLNVRMGYE